MAAKLFDAARQPLQYGISLIEASAGTGKTYTLAMLALRWVVEKNIPIEQLLIVTFTKAATEELKSRIRQRFAEAKTGCLHPDHTQDGELISWLQSLDITQEETVKRLERALQNIDQASVFTLHGFCQRVLAEHALESGQLFNSELTGDLNQIKQQCMDDFWRQQVYPLTPWQASLVCAQFSTPEQLMHSLGGLDFSLDFYPLPGHVTDDLAIVEKRARQAVAGVSELLEKIRTIRDEKKFKDSYYKNVPEDDAEWLDWLKGESLTQPALAVLSSPGLLEGLSKAKFKQSAKNPMPTEDQHMQYLADKGLDGTVVDELLDAVDQLQTGLRSAALAALRQQVDATLVAMNVLSFDHLITRLAGALKGDAGAVLIEELRQRFQVALIDEFQDTDLNQWDIFLRLFSSPRHALYLIGDPKQAIYKFRGADIFTYFSAREQAQHHFTLGYNWRSHPRLVQAVNLLFRRPQPFVFDQLQAVDVAAGRGPEDGELLLSGHACPVFVINQVTAEPKKEFWSTQQVSTVRQSIQQAVVSEIVALVKQAKILQDNRASSVQPQDIAILVRNHAQANEYQQALTVVKVPSVLNSKVSVFKSLQALQLSHLLLALLNPGKIPLLKQALAIDWFARDGQYLYQLEQQQDELNGWVQRFQFYGEQWRQDGLMAMWQDLDEQEKLSENIARLPQAERVLTNIQHCLEVLQQTAQDEHLSMHKTLEWLDRAILQNEGEGGEHLQLRLENDAQAVTIITMHSAKGLEYPVVFCPALWDRSKQLERQTHWLKCHDQGKLLLDLGSADFERRKHIALREELAEELRLCYVALTRARLACYVYWANVRTKEKPNTSSLAYLFDFAAESFEQQQAVLQQFVTESPDVFAYRLIDTEPVPQEIWHASTENNDLHCRQRQRHLYTSWQMSSYTGLSALTVETPELLQDKADEQASLTQPEIGPSELPSGAHTGNVLHQLLEDISFADIATGAEISDQRQHACLHYGLVLEKPECIDELLLNVVSTPLSDDGFSLSILEERQCLKEMPFYLSQQEMTTQAINHILVDCETFQALDKRRMSGYLTGFIDLVCEYQGRFYVMDYKSNTLPGYGTEHLIQAMREHNYGLQYWIYTVVLHHYLQQRLPDYDYTTHFGGVKYLFMRGMQTQQVGSGVFSTLPAFELVAQLSGVFFDE